MMDFSGRVLLLTGASGGIGRAIAQVFHDAGASILLADIREDAARELAQSMDPAATRTMAMKYDAGRADDSEAAVGLCLDRFGRLDFLVPAAAVFEGQSFLKMTDAQWRKTLSVNLDGVFYLCRRAIPVMPEGGAVVTIASEAAHAGASVGHSHYGASKGGVLALTRSLARELAPGIRVNAVSPGAIDTPMIKDLMRIRGGTVLEEIPMGRLGSPCEVAAAVAFLCSESARYITGQAIHVNGGSYIGG